MNVLAFVPVESPGAALHLSPSYRSCLALAQQLGCELPRHGDGTNHFRENQIRQGSPDGDVGEPGTAVIVATLALFGPGIASTIRKLTARGISTYVPSLGMQPMASLLPVIEGVAGLMKPMADENARLRKELGEVEGRWKRSYDETVANGLLQAVREAVPAMVAKMPCLGERPKGEASPSHLGEVIRHERERQGMTAQELGQRAGVSQASISHLEAGTVTTGQARDRAMEILFGPRAQLIADRQKIAATIEDNGGGSTSPAQIIS